MSDTPWGPWSESVVLFHPETDEGYGRFMHASWKDGPRRDEVHDPGRENEWGGEYGPYVVERFTKGEPGRTTIYFTLSTWNPYNVVLMKSTLRNAIRLNRARRRTKNAHDKQADPSARCCRRTKRRRG